jgi:hypothetical protein
MTDSEKPKIKINYWLVPVSGMVIFLVCTYGFLIPVNWASHYFEHQWEYAIPISHIALSGALAAITTMTALGWGPKALSILNKKRNET